MVTLAGFDSKFARAFSLVYDLEQQISDYLESQPIETKEATQPGSGDLVVTARTRTRPPEEWSILVGDALHNARSALDHLAWQLVELHSGSPDKSRFPFKDGPIGFGEELRKALPGVPTDIRDQVRALQPWRGGDDQLWLLHHLDIVDKHRLLVPVVAASRGILFEMSPEWPGKESVQLDPLEILSQDRRSELIDGAEVYRELAGARTSKGPAGPMRTRTSVTFAVIFGEGSDAAGELVGPFLRGLVQHARESVEPLVGAVR